MNLLGVVSSRHRCNILAALRDRDRHVRELAELVGLDARHVSTQLGKLREAGLVEARAVGHWHVYSLTADRGAEVGIWLDMIARSREHEAV
jgi:DNA-binding transcriptional ArsR family regulator